jgi:proteasome lid subunit RPN8/RPN11
MSEPELVVEIAGSCYYNILRSVVEVWPREVIGDLIGKRIRDRFILVNAYPWQTAVRKPTEAFHGNYAARRRVVEVMKAVNRRGGLGFSIIGYFHSHVFTPREKRWSLLGKTHDRAFFSDDMRQVNRNESVVIIASVRAKRYKKRQRPGEYISEYKKSLRVLLRDKPYHGYDIILSAFFLSLRGSSRELKRLKVKQRRIEVREKDNS